MSDIDSTLIDSEIDNCPLAPGDYYEKFIDFPPDDMYSFMTIPKDLENYTEDMGYFHLEIFTEWGQRIGSDEGNLPGSCFIGFGRTMKLKLKVTRGQSSVKNTLHFVVLLDKKGVSYGL